MSYPKYLIMFLTIILSHQAISAYTWKVTNKTGKDATIKVHIACINKGPEAFIKNGETKELKGTTGCCLKGVSVNGTDVNIKVGYLADYAGSGSINCGISAGCGMATLVAMGAIGIYDLFASGYNASVEAVARCKSRDIIVLTDGVFIFNND